MSSEFLQNNDETLEQLKTQQMLQEAERLRLLKEEELKQQRLQQEQEALRQQQLALQKQVPFFVNNSTLSITTSHQSEFEF